MPELITELEKIWNTSTLTACISAVLIILLIILFITSFPSVRSKIKASSWKSIQKLVYPFIILVYFHVMAIFGPGLGDGLYWYTVMTVITYTLMYAAYIFLHITKTKNKKVATVALAAFLIADTSLCLWGIESDRKWASLSRIEGVYVAATSATLDGNYRNGEFFGVGKGLIANITVKIQIKNNRITALEITEHSEQDEGYEEWAAIYWATHSILPKVIETQNLNIKSVKDAVPTSEGIKEAIADALRQAGQ